MGAGDHRRRPAVLALVDEHDVARPQLQHRQLDRIVAAARLAGLFDRPPVLADVAVGALRLFAQPGQPGPLTFEPGLDAHDVAIGLELRERQVEEVVRLLVPVRAHEVGGHVVRRAERRAQVERPAGGELGDRFEAHERAPRHDRVAQLVDAAATGPPGELRVLAGRQLLVMIAGELRQLLDHDGAGRHVDPDGQGLGGEHHLHEALDEAGFDDLLERRHHPGVVRSQAGLELGEELRVAEHRQIAGIERPEAGVDDPPDPVAIVVGREAQAGVETGPGSFVALVAAEDEVDRRQHATCVEQLDGLDPPRRVERAAPAPPQAALVRTAAPEPDR